MNCAHVGRASVLGEYLVRLPNLDKNFLKVETLFHEQRQCAHRIRPFEAQSAGEQVNREPIF